MEREYIRCDPTERTEMKSKTFPFLSDGIHLPVDCDC